MAGIPILRAHRFVRLSNFPIHLASRHIFFGEEHGGAQKGSVVGKVGFAELN
jgi:hypothetical protein